MKVAPVLNSLKRRENVVQTLIHTGQHYEVNTSDVFFQQLGIPVPRCKPGDRLVGNNSTSANRRDTQLTLRSKRRANSSSE